MVQFYKGGLPWQGLRADTKEQKFELIRKKKMSTPTHVLCSGMPDGVVMLLNYVRRLKFDDGPDYSFMRNTVHEMFVGEGFQRDYVFDWTVYKYQRHQQAIEQARGQEREQQTPVVGRPILPGSCSTDGVEILTPPEAPPELGLRSGESAVVSKDPPPTAELVLPSSAEDVSTRSIPGIHNKGHKKHPNAGPHKDKYDATPSCLKSTLQPVRKLIKTLN